MNITKLLNKREEGYRVTHDYDLAVRLLKCFEDGEYFGIEPVNSYGDVTDYPAPPVFACDFCTVDNYQHILALANEDGRIALQNTNKPSKRECLTGIQAHHNAIFDLVWMKKEKKLVSAGGDHRAILWDVGESTLREIAQFEGHTRSVKTVAVKPVDKAVIATGARDGVIMIWDVRSNHCKPDNYIINSHPGPGTPGGPSRCKKGKSFSLSRASSVTGLIFQDDNNLISCGAGDGMIHVWDMRKNYSIYKRMPTPKHTLPYAGNTSKNGYTSLLLDPNHVRLYASCMDDTIYCYNVASYDQKPVSTYTNHTNATFYVKSCLSPDGHYLVSGSSNDRAYIWNVKRPGPPLVTLVGHAAEVTSVAWCPVGEIKVVTISDDFCHRIWKVRNDFYGSDDDLRLLGWAEDCVSPEVAQQPTDSEDSVSVAERVMPIMDRTPKSAKQWILRQEKTPDVPSCGGSKDLPSSPTCFACTSHTGVVKRTTPCTTCVDKMVGESQLCRNIVMDIRQTGSGQDAVEPRTSKRKLDLMLYYSDESRDCTQEGGVSFKRRVLSPVKEDNGKVVRRGSIGARRLFSPSKKQNPCSSRKEELKGTVEGAKRILNESENFSGQHIFSSVVLSPTLNLPNYVLDGTSPHHFCNRNVTSKENVDWLTKLRKEKEQVDPSTIETNLIPPRRQSRSGEKSKKTRSSRDGDRLRNQKGSSVDTLLRFFRVAGKLGNELQSSPSNKGVVEVDEHEPQEDCR